MRWLKLLPAIFIGGCLLSGCTFALKDNGEISVGGGYEFTIAHTTSTTDSESVATMDVQPLMDWIVELAKESPQSVGEPDE